MHGRTTIEHEPALDGIRGAAVAAVLLFHAGHLRGGYLGVDLFFTLSGFLITSLLLAELRDHGTVRLGAFWSRRARRLLPALGILLAGVAVYARLAVRPDELNQIRWDGVWTALYAANWRAVFATTSYWSMFRAPSPLQHTWSLAIEEQFYLVWPLALFALARRARDIARATVWLALTGAVLGSVWLIVSYDPAHQSRSYFGTDTRIPSILFGATLAGLVVALPRARALPRSARVVLQLLGWAGVASIAWMWLTLDGTSDQLYRGGLTLAALSATSVIAAVTTHRRGWLARTLSLRPLCALGLLSYGIYLYHWPIYVWLTPARIGYTGWPLTGVRIGVTLVVAIASYCFVERPIRRGVTRRRLLSTGAAAIATIAAVALVTATAGAHPVIDEAAGAVDNTAVVTRAAVRAATHAGPDAPERDVRLMLAGSSIAALLTRSIRETPAARHLVVLNRAVIACAFPNGISRVEPDGQPAMDNQFHSCGRSWHHDVDLFQPDAVLYIPGAEPGSARFEFARRHGFVAPCSPTYEGIYRADLLRHIAMFTRPGTTVYLATFAYSALPFLPSSWYRGTDCINALIRSVARTTPGTALIDMFAYMCPHVDQACRFRYHGAPIRPDGTHYFGPGAAPIAAWIVSQIHLGPQRYVATAKLITPPGPDGPNRMNPYPHSTRPFTMDGPHATLAGAR